MEQYDFEKVVRVGTIPQYMRPKTNLFVKIEYKNKKLSISGVIGPLRSGNATGGCGQIDMEFAHRDQKDNDLRYKFEDLIHPSQIDYAKSWTDTMWLDLLDAWKKWHLNDMNAECEHQKALGKNWENSPGDVCPICKWKLGHGWKKETVPPAILRFLISLPDTDRKPAWI